MDKGWENESVEKQIPNSTKEKEDAAGANTPRHIIRPPRPSREKESLMLARTRLLRDIESTDNPRYRLFLETSLAAVEKQISEIQ